MKKLLAILCAAMLCLSLVACGGSSDSIEGTWELKTMDIGTGEPIDVDDFVDTYGVEVSITFEFNSDGTMSGNVNMAGTEQSGEGTWEQTGDNTYALTMEGGTEEATLEDGVLSMEFNGYSCTFEK